MAEQGAAITIDLIHVIAFFTLASAEHIGEKGTSSASKLQPDVDVAKSPGALASGKSLSLCKSLFLHHQDEMLKRYTSVGSHDICLIFCF